METKEKANFSLKGSRALQRIEVEAEENENAPSEEEVAGFIQLLDSESEDDVQMAITFFASNQGVLSDEIFQKISGIFTSTENQTIAEYALDFFSSLSEKGTMPQETLEATLSSFSSYIDSELRPNVLKCIYIYVRTSEHIKELCATSGLLEHILEIINELLPSTIENTVLLTYAISVVAECTSLESLNENGTFLESLNTIIQQIVNSYKAVSGATGPLKKKWNKFIKGCFANFTTIVENESDEFVGSMLTPVFLEVLRSLFALEGETALTVLKFIATATGCDSDEISAAFLETFILIIRTSRFDTFGQSELTYTGRILYNLASCDTPEIIAALCDEAIDDFINYTTSRGSFVSNTEIISAFCSLISTGNDEIISNMLEKHYDLIKQIMSLLASTNRNVLVSCLGCILALLSHLSTKDEEQFRAVLDEMVDSGAMDALDTAEDLGIEEISDMVERIRSIIEFDE